MSTATAGGRVGPEAVCLPGDALQYVAQRGVLRRGHRVDGPEGAPGTSQRPVRRRPQVAQSATRTPSTAARTAAGGY